MYESLRGKTLFIGKEQTQGRLAVFMEQNGKPLMALSGLPGSVPNSVSRCKPAEKMAHCKIDVDRRGNLLLTNLKPQNVTYVNGVEVLSKKISLDSKIELGRDHFQLDILNILDIATKLMPIIYSIRPLERVWNDYEQKTYGLKRKQRSLANLKSLYMPCVILSTLSGVIVRYLGADNNVANAFSYVFYGIAAVIMFYGLYKSWTDKSLEEGKKITDEFQRDYVCPNPECRHYLNMQSYQVLRQNKKCPYCGCLWNEQ